MKRLGLAGLLFLSACFFNRQPIRPSNAINFSSIVQNTIVNLYDPYNGLPVEIPQCAFGKNMFPYEVRELRTPYIIYAEADSFNIFLDSCHEMETGENKYLGLVHSHGTHRLDRGDVYRLDQTDKDRRRFERDEKAVLDIVVRNVDRERGTFESKTYIKDATQTRVFQVEVVERWKPKN